MSLFNKRNATIFLLMQVFFVVFGIALFFGLKALQDSRKPKPVFVETIAPEGGAMLEGNAAPGCDFARWVGLPVDEQAIKETGRPYRVLPPGSVATMDYNPDRLNVHLGDGGIVIAVTCG